MTTHNARADDNPANAKTDAEQDMLREEAAQAEAEAADDFVSADDVLAAEDSTDGAANQALEQERDDWKNRALRLAADMENLRKRTQKEIEDARKYAVTNLAREMLGISDNMERALSEIRKHDTTQEPLKSMNEGIAMVVHQFGESMDRLNIKRIKAVGEKMDPEKHQVMMEVDSPDAEPGTVVQELQAGYTIGERLLRPVLVATAKKTVGDQKTEN